VDAERTCENCGYKLGGITATACPECGSRVDRAQFARPSLALERSRLGAALLVWALPATGLAFLVAVTAADWIGPNNQVEFRMNHPTVIADGVSSLATIPALLMLAGAWMLEGQAPLIARRILRAVCIVGAAVLVVLAAHRSVDWQWVPPSRVWYMRTQYLRDVPLFLLTVLLPVFIASLLITAGSIARALGHSQDAHRWVLAAVVLAVMVTVAVGGDWIAQWVWNQAPRNAMGQVVFGPSGSPTYDPDRAVFVRAIFRASIGASGIVVWLVMVRLRMLLARASSF
jgi:hypothetical protein